MATILWPRSVLKPKRDPFNIAPRTLAGPSSVSGVTQVTASDAVSGRRRSAISSFVVDRLPFSHFGLLRTCWKAVCILSWFRVAALINRSILTATARRIRCLIRIQARSAMAGYTDPDQSIFA
ncbi:hypothetical protein B3286c1_1789 [Brucella vulpis]|nr:hypothetical protein BF3285c1_1790 [Brucella vulpis]CUW50590.1 hypothetical protein B3286c1_1789 [Brucella vulpis]